MPVARSCCALVLLLLTFFFTGVFWERDLRGEDPGADPLFDDILPTEQHLSKYMPLNRWDPIYVKLGHNQGIAPLVVSRWPGERSIYTVVNQQGMVKVANASARSGVRTDRGFPGVEHIHCPAFTRDQLDRIIAESDARVARGNYTVDYGVYRAAARHVPRAGAVLGVLMGGGTLLLDSYQFATASGFNFALCLWGLYVIHMILLNTGMVDRLRSMNEAIWAFAATAGGMFYDGYSGWEDVKKKADEWAADLNTKYDTKLNGSQVMQAIVMVLGLILLAIFKWRRIWGFLAEMGFVSPLQSPGGSQDGTTANTGSHTPLDKDRQEASQTTRTLEMVAQSLSKLAESQEKLERRIADSLLAPPPPVSVPGAALGTPADAGVGPMTMEDLYARLGRFENLIKQDTLNPRLQGGQDPRDSVPHIDTVLDEALLATMKPVPPMSPPASHALMGAATSLVGDPSAEDSEKVMEIVRELEADAQNPSELLIGELRRFVPVKPWKLESGYQVRMTPKFMANLLKGGLRLLAVMTTFVADHGMKNSVYGKELLRGAAHIDGLLYVDRIGGFINWVTTERMIRRLHGLMLCFRNVTKEEEWKRTKTSPANFRPLTDWKSCDLVDPSHLDGTQFRLEELEAEMQKERERSALILKAQSKISTLATTTVDPRDGVGG